MSARSVPEWIGKNPDSMPPPRVRLRIFQAHGGRCHITGQQIRSGDEWDLDHVVELIMGGENRESNLRPALRRAHREKTKEAMGRRAKADAVAKRALGIARPKQPIRSANTLSSGRPKADKLPLPPRRLMYVER